MLDRLKCQAYCLPMPAAQTPAIILTWTDAPKGKKQGRAVSRRFDAVLLDGRTVASVVETKRAADLQAAAEADLRRFGAAGEGPFAWTPDAFEE